MTDTIVVRAYKLWINLIAMKSKLKWINKCVVIHTMYFSLLCKDKQLQMQLQMQIHTRPHTWGYQIILASLWAYRGRVNNAHARRRCTKHGPTRPSQRRWWFAALWANNWVIASAARKQKRIGRPSCQVAKLVRFTGLIYESISVWGRVWGESSWWDMGRWRGRGRGVWHICKHLLAKIF